MMAMQYGFNLPADYDISIIERRIKDKGPAFDDVPGLWLKAFLVARRGDAKTGAQENAYAPFYVWADASAMNDFLCGERFDGLVRSFWRPMIDLWAPLFQAAAGPVTQARLASRRIVEIPADTPMQAVRKEGADAARRALDAGALFALSALDPTRWRHVVFCLWHDIVPGATEPAARLYDVLHVSAPLGGSSKA